MLQGYPADRARSYADLERSAARVRSALDFEHMDRLPGVQFFERLEDYTVAADGRDIPLTYAVGGSLPREAIAKFDPHSQKIVLALDEHTYDALERWDYPRSRFSVFHELAHAVEHTGLLLRLAEIPHEQHALMRSGTPKHPAYLDTEWQANGFAAAILMPAMGLVRLEEEHGSLTADLVADHYGVSMECAGYRLDTFGNRRAVLVNAGTLK